MEYNVSGLKQVLEFILENIGSLQVEKTNLNNKLENLRGRTDNHLMDWKDWKKKIESRITTNTDGLAKNTTQIKTRT